VSGKSGPRGPTAVGRRGRALELAAEGYGSATIAERLGVSKRHARRLVQSVEVELRLLRDERWRALSDRTATLATGAVVILSAIALDESQPAGARVAAAGRLLEGALKLAEIHDLAERVATLERRLVGLAYWDPSKPGWAPTDPRLLKELLQERLRGRDH
jgi:hypothetical protein